MKTACGLFVFLGVHILQYAHTLVCICLRLIMISKRRPMPFHYRRHGPDYIWKYLRCLRINQIILILIMADAYGKK